MPELDDGKLELRDFGQGDGRHHPTYGKRPQD
jgi:hypothetical protein